MWLRLGSACCWLALLPPLCACEPLHRLFAAAFTPSECADLVLAFDDMEREVDRRSIELLPSMEADEFGVNRVNRFDAGRALMRAGKFDLVHQRLLELGAWPLLLPNATHTLAEYGAMARRSGVGGAVASLVDFHLLHEFEPGGHFDWHVDTKPRDGTSRTVNVNVLLSAPGVDYEGGELQVGADAVVASQGDMYVYGAATPHRVSPLTRGRRFTLVIALTEARHEESLGGASSRDTVERRAAYWAQAEANLAALADGPLAAEPKVHILRGEHLEAAGRADEAKRSFCASYRATPTAAEFAAEFVQKGTAELQLDGSRRPDLRLAESYLSMALCIAPANSDAADALKVVRDALRLVEGDISGHRGYASPPGTGMDKRLAPMRDEL